MSFSNTTKQSQKAERTESMSQVERVQVQFESGQIRIRKENYDEKLGWYVSGSLQLPDHLLPLLEQALDRVTQERTLRTEPGHKVLPFRKNKF